jgi:hypothetical protein
MDIPRRTSRLLAVGAAAALLSLTACSAGSDDSPTAMDAGGAGDVAVPEAASAPDTAPDTASEEGAGADKDASGGTARSAVDLVEQQAVIKTGAVSLRSDDVDETRFGVQALVDRHGGSVADEQTETDKTGEGLRSRMVVRVPSEDFDDVMSDLADLAQLASRTSSAEDVTTQLIDVDAQIKVQQASVQRVRQLLTRAQSIRDIMAIESELANRQAQLDSLSQQQAYLKNQTSLATIKVSIERKPEAVVKKDEDRTGFLGGLGAGWDGLRASVVAVLTVVGAVLPFAAVALLVGVPLWLLVRRLRPSPATVVTAPGGE